MTAWEFCYNFPYHVQYWKRVQGNDSKESLKIDKLVFKAKLTAFTGTFMTKTSSQTINHNVDGQVTLHEGLFLAEDFIVTKG